MRMHGAITLDSWLVWARDMGSGDRVLTKIVYKNSLLKEYIKKYIKTVYKKNRQGAAASCLSDRSGYR